MEILRGDSFSAPNYHGEETESLLNYNSLDDSLGNQSSITKILTNLDPNVLISAGLFNNNTTIRPNINEIREKTRKLIINKEPPVDDPKKSMGMFTGVFLPIFVSLISMTYWTRIGKLVGDCGIFYSILILWIAAAVSLILMTSLAALSTNGEMDGGGIYFIISRTIGPEIGRSLNLFLDISTCLSAASVVISFAETIVSMYQPNFLTGKEINDIRVIAFIIMLLSIPLSFKWTYSLRITSVTHCIGIICFILGCLIRYPESTEGFTGISLSTFKNNMLEPMNFSKFFSYIYLVTPGFTALTGCFAYAGNLKKPGKMIPCGMFYAFIASLIIWHVTILLIGSCSDKLFLQSNDISPILAFSLNKWIGFFTIMVYSIHRSLGNIGYQIGLITEMANDNVLPKIIWHYDYIIPLVLTSIFVCFGNLDFTANINTIFFLTMTVVFNYCVFLISRSHITGWRPRAKYWSPALSMFGSIITLLLCIMISWKATIINWAIFGTIFFISYRQGSDLNLGSLLQANAFYNAFTHALKMQKILNPKIHMLNILALTREDEDILETTLPFIENLIGSDSVCIISQVISESKGIGNAIQQRIEKQKIFSVYQNLFYETVMANSDLDALPRQLLTSGFGSVRPNSVFLGVDNRDNTEIYMMAKMIMESNLGLIMVSRPHDIIYGSEFIDIYCLAGEKGLSLLVGSSLAKSLKKKARIYAVYKNSDDDAEIITKIETLRESFGITADVEGIEVDDPSTENMSINMMDINKNGKYAELIRNNSLNSAIIVSTIFGNAETMDAVEFSQILKLMSSISPTVVLVSE